MSLVLQSSGGGQITIQEPTTASNFTQSLPAATGTVVISGTTPSLNGITFPSTQSASTDANTLDDYEEGTWTPVVTAQSGSFTTVTVSGNYVKTGKQVTVNFRFTLTDIGTGSTGIFVEGFPFAAINGATLSGCTREDQVTGFASCASPTSATQIFVSKFDGTSIVGAGRGFSFCISYITA